MGTGWCSLYTDILWFLSNLLFLCYFEKFLLIHNQYCWFYSSERFSLNNPTQIYFHKLQFLSSINLVFHCIFNVSIYYVQFFSIFSNIHVIQTFHYLFRFGSVSSDWFPFHCFPVVFQASEFYWMLNIVKCTLFSTGYSYSTINILELFFVMHLS